MRARPTIGRYELLEPIAGSGLSVIVRARSSDGGGEVALKLYHPPRGMRREEIEEFLASTRRLVELDHPHILRVFAAEEDAGVPFVAREWLGGGSLAERLANGRRAPEEEVIAIGLQVASAMAAAESVGVRHRDLEPGNLIFADASTIKVGDFAQAVFFDRASGEAGTVWGTLPYVAPERLRNEAEDSRSDIYGLGATLFHALTGQAPHGGEAQGEPLIDRLLGEPLRIDRALTPVHAFTAALLEQMLSLIPEGRPQDWRETQQLFERAEKTMARPLPAPAVPAAAPAAEAESSATRTPWVTIGMLLLLVLVVVGAVWQLSPPQGAVPVEVPADEAVAVPEPAPEIEAVSAPSRGAVPVVASRPAVSVITPPAAPLPAAKRTFDFAGWTTAKLDPAPNKDSVAGEATALPDGASLRLAGSNDGVGGKRDAVVFHNRELSGDWTLEARVASVSGGVAGLMVREDLELSRWCLAVTASEDGSVIAKTRPAPDIAASVSTPVPGPPQQWLKLTRRGGTFEAQRSSDGQTWQPAGSFTPPGMPEKVSAGFITHALTKAGAATATFDHINLLITQ